VEEHHHLVEEHRHLVEEHRRLVEGHRRQYFWEFCLSFFCCFLLSF